VSRATTTSSSSSSSSSERDALDAATVMDAGAAPVAVLRVTEGAGAVRFYPLFRRAEELVAGGAPWCGLWVEGAAPEAVRLAWDGIFLRALALDGAAVSLGDRALADGVVVEVPRGAALRIATTTIALELLLASEETYVERAAPPSPTAPTAPVRLPQATVSVAFDDTPPTGLRTPARQPAAVWRPSRHAADEHEVTAVRDAQVALLPAPDLFDRLDRRRLQASLQALLRRRRARRSSVRPSRLRLVLLLVGLLAASGATAASFLVHPKHPAAPQYVGVERPAARAEETPPVAAPETPAARAATLRAAIDAYRKGQTTEAATHFNALAAGRDGEADAAPRFMLWLLRAREGRRR